MKDWIKNLTSEDIKAALLYKPTQPEDVPEMFNRVVTRVSAGIHEQIGKKKRRKALVIRIMLAAAVLLVILLPGILLFNTFYNPHKLFLSECIHNVIIEGNTTVPGYQLKENYSIKTGKESSCTIAYRKKSTMELFENTDTVIAEFSKDRIMLYLSMGKLLISENKNKGAQVHVKTPNTVIYALGTKYFVEYTGNKETYIKVFEGSVHIEKIPQAETIILNAGEEIIINHNKQGEKDIVRVQKEWRVKTVYFDKKEPVIGFTTNGEATIAVTGHSVVCFSEDYNLWQHIADKVTIIAAPVIFKEKVYIPCKKTVLVYSLQDGTQKPDVPIFDLININQKIIAYQDNLYITCTTGVYIYNEETGLNTNPVNKEVEIVSPAIAENKMYVASPVLNFFKAFDLSGNELWAIPLDGKSSCSPVVFNNVVFAGTGTLYKISKEGAVIGQAATGGTIMSILPMDEEKIFVHTKENRLYKINYRSFKKEEVFEDVTSAIVYNNTLITGKMDNTINIIDERNKHTLAIPQAQVSSFITKGDIIYAGLTNGTIVKLEYKDVTEE